MKPRQALLVLLLIGLSPLLHAQAKTRAEAPKGTALAGSISLWNSKPSDRDFDLAIIGGPVAGKGWVKSEGAKALLEKGDRLSLYALEAGEIGTATLTSGGALDSEKPPDGGESWGLGFKARLTIPEARKAPYEKAHKLRQTDFDNYVDLPVLAAWTRDGSKPQWVSGELLVGQRAKESTYWEAAADWLRTKGVPQKDIDGMQIKQVVRADINRDGRHEIFISLGCAATWGYRQEDLKASGYDDETASRVFYSYLLIRRLRPGSEQVETLILDDEPWRSLYVCGFCDLDRDGTAEVIVSGSGIDWSGSMLYHWDGKRFQAVEGWGGGC